MTMTTGHAVTADDPDLLSDEEARSLVVGALHAGAPDIVVQPILGLTVGRVVAYEALARFSFGEHYLPPDKWFGWAHRAGLGALIVFQESAEDGSQTDVYEVPVNVG